VIGKVDAEEGQGCKRQTGLCVDQRKDRETHRQVKGLQAGSRKDEKIERAKDGKEGGIGTKRTTGG
jgi:hypothetical protein